MQMPASLAEYACDTCRLRKLACSREPSGCRRCKTEGNIACSYSRSGVIRRNRKRKAEGQDRPPTRHTYSTLAPTEPSVIGTTHERLQRFVGKDHESLRVLASLLEEHAAAWQGSFAFDKLAEGAEADFFRFEEDQVRAWVDAFSVFLEEERLLFTSVPSEVLEHLAGSRPHQVCDRAWLVMFYSIALSIVSSTHPPDESTKAKLKSNLWLAFNNVKLLLEPNASSIQALVILACYVEEFMTPSICWALISKACIMLQALGITHWRLDSSVRERRTVLFWRLNVLDKALALILCRPPNFHREMTTEIALPTLDRLLPSKHHHTSFGAPVLFDSHYKNQMHLLSLIMADVWYCLYGRESDDVHAIKENLESWHRQATEVLEAAALAEKPLLTASGAASVDLGLRTLRFHYYSLLVLLTVSSKQLRMQCTYLSQHMLRLLPSPDTVRLDLKEPYTCLLWQRLQCPLVAFGALWGQIVMKDKNSLEHSKQSLEDIERLPAYFGKLSLRNALAAKLESITDRIIQHARLIFYSQDEASQIAPTPCVPALERPDGQRSDKENLEQHSNTPMPLLTSAQPISVSNSLESENVDAELDGMFTWPDDCFLDATFDWFAWGNQETS